MTQQKQENYLQEWKEHEACAEQMLPIIGRLYRDHNIILTLYGRTLVHSTVIDILKAHRFARMILDSELSVIETFPLLVAMDKLDLAPGRVDLGKLTIQFQKLAGTLSADDFIKQELSRINTGHASVRSEPQDIVLYGFGRIGRLLARILIEKSGSGEKLRIRAAVVRKGGADDLLKRASLLRRDSVHGQFNGIITVDEEENAIIANGNMIRIIYADAPDKVDYTQYGIHDAILIDNYHAASRRGRSAPLNMVITETGAAKAVAKVIPELSGKLTGNAIRVPTPNVSLAIMNLELGHAVDVETINSYLRNMSLDSPLQNQIDFTNSPEVVSSDFVGSRHAGVVDSLATIAEGNRCVLYVWYDNEFGYSCQVVRMVQQMAGLELPTLPS